MPISAFQQLQGVPASGAATQGGGDPNMLIEALPYLLAMLGSAVAPEGSPIQQIANQVGNLAQRKSLTQYIARKRIDPKTPPPLGLSPELQMQVDGAIAQENAMKFQQEMAIEMQKMDKEKAASDKTLAERQMGALEARTKMEETESAANSVYRQTMVDLQKAEAKVREEQQKGIISNQEAANRIESDRNAILEKNGINDNMMKAFTAYINGGGSPDEALNIFGQGMNSAGIKFNMPTPGAVPPPVDTTATPTSSDLSTYQNFANMYGDLLNGVSSLGFNLGNQVGVGTQNPFGFTLPNLGNFGMPRQSKKALQDLYPYIEQLLPYQSQNALKGIMGK